MARCDFDHGKPRMVDYTPGAAVSAGDVIVLGDGIRIAHNDIAAGVKDALAAGGAVYKNAPKASGDGGWADGAKLYWNTTTNVLTTTAAGAKPAGFAVGAAATGDTTAKFLHWPC